MDYCPFNFYRTSPDVSASYTSVLRNLQSTVKYAQAGLSRPGCWAYADMLELGCAQGAHGDKDIGLTPAESRSHFWSWVIVSSPLTLSMDVNNDTIMDEVWPLISNPEVLEVNQAYAGFSGGPFQQDDSHSQFFYKPIDSDRMAVLLLNNDDQPSDLSFAFTDIPGNKCARSNAASCNVRDINTRKDLGSFVQSYTAKQVGAHDAMFLMLSSVSA